MISDDPVLRRLEEYIRGKIQLRLETLNVSFEDLLNAPPEFRPEDLDDPSFYARYRAFLLLKESYKKPVALAVLYFFENKLGYVINEMYFHDLIAGSPAWEHGVSGRDIDYVLVINKKPDLEIVKRIETYLDDTVGAAITNFFFKKGLCNCTTPFNKLIKHNLVELHVILPREKASYGLNGSFHSVPIEKANLEKYRKRIREMMKHLHEKMDYFENYMDL